MAAHPLFDTARDIRDTAQKTSSGVIFERRVSRRRIQRVVKGGSGREGGGKRETPIEPYIEYDLRILTRTRLLKGI